MASYFTADVQGTIGATKSTSDTISCGAAAGAADLVLTTGRDTDDHDLVLPRHRCQRDVLYRRTCANGVLTGVPRHDLALGDADLLL